MTRSLHSGPRAHAVVAALCAAFALTAAGCTAAGGNVAPSQGASGTSDASAATVVFTDVGNVATLDPAAVSYNQTLKAVQMMYDSLVEYDADHKLANSLAESAEYSADVTSINVVLREGVKFHDGTPLTAKDVAYTLDRTAKLPGVSSLLGNYKSTTVESDTKLAINLKSADALFMGALSKVYILNSALVGQNAGSDQAQSWLTDHDAGSGPYTLKSFVSGKIEFSRFADYWSFDAGRAGTYVHQQMDQPSSRADALISGSVSIAPIDGQDQERVEAAGLKTISASGSMTGVFFNNHTGPTTNPKLREAIILAYDYEGALAKIMHGMGEIPNGPLPSFLQCRPDLPKVHQDLDKAKQLVQEAGLDGAKITMRFQPAFPDQAQMATLLQSNLSSIGIKLDLQPITYPDYLTMLRDWNKIPSMMLLGENLPYPDSGVQLQQVYHSKSIGSNKGAYSNPEVDALLDKANTTPSADERCSLYQQAQEKIAADNPVMPMFYGQAVLAYTPNLTNITMPDPTSGVALQNVKVQ
nr:ABC transporter substrate-binding protein [Propionicimonas sp.]